MNQTMTEKVDRSRELRRFGWVVSGGFAILAGIIRWRSGEWGNLPIGLIVLALILLAFSIVAPTKLARFHTVWMAIGHGIGWFNTRLILGAFFYLVMTPVGLVMRAFGNDPMKRNERSESYWRKPVAHSRGDRHFEKQF